MKQLKRGIALLLVFAAAVAPWAPTSALERFEKAGIIAAIDSNGLSISDQVYQLRSSTVLVSSSPDRSKIDDLKKGDRIYVRGIVLNGKYYISKLVYEIPDPS